MQGMKYFLQTICCIIKYVEAGMVHGRRLIAEFDGGRAKISRTKFSIFLGNHFHFNALTCDDFLLGVVDSILSVVCLCYLKSHI